MTTRIRSGTFARTINSSIEFPEVWFVFLEHNEVRRLRLAGGEYHEVEHVSVRQTGVPGVTVPRFE